MHFFHSIKFVLVAEAVHPTHTRHLVRPFFVSNTLLAGCMVDFTRAREGKFGAANTARNLNQSHKQHGGKCTEFKENLKCVTIKKQEVGSKKTNIDRPN